MGSFSSVLGFGGADSTQGASGARFNASAANLTTAATKEQADEQYANAQKGLAEQMNFLKAIQGQNGIQNQSDVYNMLAGVANGQGPNPAQAMLNQATSTNVANQAALMAGQRGTGANAGLLARQAAQQGGALQQQAAGQGATMQAQQAMNAINSMGNIAGQQVGNQAAATAGYNQMAQNEQNMILNAIAARNNAEVGMQSNMNEQNAKIAQGVMGTQAGIVGGLMNSAGGGAAAAGATGGEVKKDRIGNNPKLMADGGVATSQPSTSNGPQSSFGKFMQSLGTSMQNSNSFGAGKENSADYQGGEDFGKGLGQLIGSGAKAISNAFKSSPTMVSDNQTATQNFSNPDSQGVMNAAHGGKVPAKLSPGEVYLPPKKVSEVAKGKASPLEGKKVPGKAKVKGDSLKNDTVNATLEEGGIVIPRSVINSKDPHKAASDFVAAVLSKHRK